MAANQFYTFTIHISNGGDSEIEYSVTPKELDLIHEAIDNGDSFEDVEELEDLYERVLEAAQQELSEDLDLTDDNIDPDDLDCVVDF